MTAPTATAAYDMQDRHLEREELNVYAMQTLQRVADRLSNEWKTNDEAIQIMTDEQSLDFGPVVQELQDRCESVI